MVLINTLKRLLLLRVGQPAPQNGSTSPEFDLKNRPGPPTTAQLQAAFATYEKQRAAQAAILCKLSGKYTRVCGWASRYKRVLDCAVFPLVKGDSLLVTYAIGNQVRRLPVLEWLGEEHFATGMIAWTHGQAGKSGQADRRGLFEKCKWRVIDLIMPAVVALL